MGDISRSYILYCVSLLCIATFCAGFAIQGIIADFYLSVYKHEVQEQGISDYLSVCESTFLGSKLTETSIIAYFECIRKDSLRYWSQVSVVTSALSGLLFIIWFVLQISQSARNRNEANAQ